MDTLTASIIVVNFNGAPYLRKLIESLDSQTFRDFELIIVDNASADNSIRIIESINKYVFFKISVLKSKRNLGFCEGNNQGAKIAHGKYIILLNNDTYVHPQWLEELVKAADKDTKVAIFQSSIYSFDGTIQNIGFMLDKYGDILPILNPEECHSLFYANGASILLRSSVIKRIGLFDKELFILQDDVDLSWRTRLCGYEIGLVPTSICFHKSNASMPPLPFLAYYEFRNRIRVLIKNYSSSNIVKRAALAIAIIEFDSLVLSIKSGSAYFALSYIRAIWWNLIKLSDTLKQRTLVQKMRRIADSEIEKYMLNYPIMILRAHVRLHHT